MTPLRCYSRKMIEKLDSIFQLLASPYVLGQAPRGATITTYSPYTFSLKKTMLQNSFIHISGIGKKTEQNLWRKGIKTWDMFKQPFPASLSKTTLNRLRDGLGNHPTTILDSPDYLYKTLPSNQHWRLFPRFRHTTAYIDIETTGTHHDCTITTIALYDGNQTLTFVNGDNLHTFPEVLKRYQLIVTYNGKSFDVPIIKNFFNIDVPQAHLDLRGILAAIGLKGGLKGCEKQLGIDRQELAGVDGYGAVLLWRDYERFKNKDVLDTLLAYNIADAVNLEPLLIHAYNRNLQDTPFYPEKKISQATYPQSPYSPHPTVVARVKKLLANYNR